MWYPSWSRSRRSASPYPRAKRPSPPRPFRPTLQQLEDRTLPSNYTAPCVTDLISDIAAANTAGGSNTITLVANTTFSLSAVNNTSDGPTGLPAIAKGDHLTIAGNGDTIERSTASGTPAFRLFDVASGGSLTLQNLTLQNGLARGSGKSAEGGAIINKGTLTLNGVTVQNDTVTSNSALAGSGRIAGGGEGGGLYLASGSTVCLDAFTQTNVTNNTASDPSGDNIVGTYSTC
jgi:hypothetical protein